MLAVFKDQLAGEEDQAAGFVTLEMLVAVIQELGQLARIGSGRTVVELAGRIEGDAGFGRIRDDETDFGLLGQFAISVEISVGIQAAGDDVDQIDAVNGLAIA